MAATMTTSSSGRRDLSAVAVAVAGTVTVGGSGSGSGGNAQCPDSGQPPDSGRNAAPTVGMGAWE